MRKRKPSLRRVTIVAGAVVAVSTLALPIIKGCGTVLSLILVLWAWGTVAWLFSPAYANEGPLVMWCVAGILNVLLFGVLQGAIWLLGRRFQERIQAATTVAGLLTYLSLLLWLGRATDCP